MRKGQYGKAPKEEGDPRPAAPYPLDSVPRLWEFLAHRQFEGGERRLPGSLTLFYQDGGFKVCLSDKDSGSVGFVWGPDPYEAVMAAERGLEENTIDWRSSTPPPRKR